MTYYRSVILTSVGFLGLCSPSASNANPGSQYYSYDPLGRLSQTCRALASSGELSTYVLDGADNRQSYTNTETDVIVTAGAYVTSANGQFLYTMQTDGNFVVYGPSGSLWATNTVGSGATLAAFQSDGNLVLWNGPAGTPVWASNSSGNPCASIIMQNDGNLVIINTSGNVAWSTNTGGH